MIIRIFRKQFYFQKYQDINFVMKKILVEIIFLQKISKEAFKSLLHNHTYFEISIANSFK